MKMKSEVETRILSRLTMHKKEDYLARLYMHFEQLPSMTPEKWNWYEPINIPYQTDYNWASIFDYEEPDPDGLLWKRLKQTRAWGSFKIAQPKRPDGSALDSHAEESIFSELKQTNFVELINHVKLSSVAFKADLAFIELASERYTKEVVSIRRKYDGRPFASSIIGQYTHAMRHWLDDIYWVTVFGDAYVRLFGMDKLLTVPAYKVEQLSDDTVYIQLTESIETGVTNFEEMQRIRQAVKEHLDPDAFFHIDKAYYTTLDEDGWPLADSKVEGDVFNTPTFNLLSDDTINRETFFYK